MGQDRIGGNTLLEGRNASGETNRQWRCQTHGDRIRARPGALWTSASTSDCTTRLCQWLGIRRMRAFSNVWISHSSHRVRIQRAGFWWSRLQSLEISRPDQTDWL